ncbi:MAG: glycosyltransferase family 1 protein [Candidatus Falkowbacteria bacterium]
MTVNKKKKIGIDARFYGPLGKGLGRYTQEIVDNIINIDKDNEYVVFLGPDNFDEFIVDPTDVERVKKVKIDIRWYTLREQVLFPYYIYRQHLNLIHFPHFNVPIFTPGKFVVTVHDLILTKFPTVRATTLNPAIYKLKNLAYRLVIWLALKRSQKIITVSEFTKNDIIEQFHINENKIIVTYEGVANLAKGHDTLFVQKLDEEGTLERYKIKDNFLLYIGNAYPHKNLEGLVRVFSKILREYPKMRLVLVGKSDYFYERVKSYAKSLDLYQDNQEVSPIIFPGYVSDSELEVLFKRALFYIFPSLYEGFGLPPLEAMAKGCPVLSSNKSSMPEILGKAACYFNPEDDEEMKRAILKMIEDKNLRDELSQKGLGQAKKYNWWECAYATYKIYYSILYGNQKA